MSMLQTGIIVAAAGGLLAVLLTLTSVWQPGRARVRRRLADECAGEPVRTPLYRDLEALGDDLAAPGPAAPKFDLRARDAGQPQQVLGPGPQIEFRGGGAGRGEVVAEGLEVAVQRLSLIHI